MNERKITRKELHELLDADNKRLEDRRKEMILLLEHVQEIYLESNNRDLVREILEPELPDLIELLKL